MEKAVALSPMAWVNVAFVLLAAFFPMTKDLLTPELEMAVAAVVNAAVHIYERVKASKEAA